MEYVEEESRPRFVFHTRAAAPSAPKLERHRPSALHAATCLSAAAVLLLSAVSLVESQFLSSLLFWAALSLLLGPFAPPSITGGDPRVGRGPTLPPLPEPQPQPQPSTDPKKQRQRPRSAPSPPLQPPIPTVRSVVPENTKSQDPAPNGNGSAKELKEMEEKEWTEEELGILRKQISRHPAGEPRRWDRIAEAFDGRRSVDSIIRMAKSLSEKKPGGGDSYAQFLKQRKPLDKRVEIVDKELGDDDRGGMENDGEDGKKESWSGGEDLALLNALKAFPKDAQMRWEKIAAAVPGKSKASCMKRVAELKRDFRSSKASETHRTF